MTWMPCPFWPGCGAPIEGACGECDPEIDEREEAYWENLSEDEWEDYAEEEDDPMTDQSIPHNDDIVGHKTFATGPLTYRHEPLTRKEAEEIWAAADGEATRRARVMPDEQSAIRWLFDAWLRLKELGWREAVYCPKDGTEFQIIEAGSTGIFDANYSGEWPDGYIISRDDHDSYVSRPGGPILFRAKASE